MIEPLLRVARTPAKTVSVTASVDDAVQLMVETRIGAVAVVDEGNLVGIFTERDIMTKVVSGKLDSARTPVADVMVRNPVSVGCNTPRSEALELMVTSHFRHLPILGADGGLAGMLSIRHLLRHQVERLKSDMDSLEQYIAADGPGG